MGLTDWLCQSNGISICVSNATYKKIKKIYLLPCMNVLDDTRAGEKNRLKVPEFTGHTAAVVAYR